MNATEVKGSQATAPSGGSDSVTQSVDDAQAAARAAADAARKAAEAAAAVAAERNVVKARELEARAKALAELATKAAQKASNAAAKLSGALEKLENRGKGDPKLAAAVEKATAAAKAAKASAAAATQSAAAATRARAQKPVDRYESLKDRQLEGAPKAPSAGPVLGPPAPQAKPWHPPMAPPAQPPGRDFFAPSKPTDIFPKPAPARPLTPPERLELARERRYEQAERGAKPVDAFPRDFSFEGLPSPGTSERKLGTVLEYSHDLGGKTVGATELGFSIDKSRESMWSFKASEPRLQPGGATSVTYEVKQEVKTQSSTGVNVDHGLYAVRAGHTIGQSKELTYELTMSAETVQRLRQSPEPAPDLFDVRTLPVGSTVVVKMDELQTSGLELEVSRAAGVLPGTEKLKLTPALKPLPGVESPGAEKKPEPNRVMAGGRFNPSGADISGRSVAIERVDDNTVRLAVGPTEGLKGALSLGAFVEDENGLFETSATVEGERSFITQNLRSVELDLRKPGADAVYDYFLRNGTLPQGGGSAVIGGSESIQTSFKAGGKLEGAARAGPLAVAASVNTEYGIDQKQSFQTDGAVSSEFTVNNGDRTLQVSKKFDAKGNPTAEGTSTSYVVQGAAPEVAEGYRRIFTPAPTDRQAAIQGPQNLELRFTPAQAADLGGIAQKYVADWEAHNNQTFNSAAEPLIWSLAQAKTPDEAATSLMDAGGRDEDYRALTELADFHQRTTHAPRLPGSVLVVAPK